MNKSIFPLLFICLIICLSCKKDEAPTQSCVTCNSTQTTPFEVCKNSKGNATVNGEDTGTNYNIYITGLEESGVSCGG